jgi:Protein of unknown function (DUF3108)
MSIDRRGATTALLALVGAFLPARARAVEDAASESLVLSAIWSGLPMADVRLSTSRDGDELTSSLEIDSRGLAALVTDWSSRMRSVSRGLVPVSFRVRNASKRYDRDIEIDYDTQGRIARLDLRKRGEPQHLPFAMDLTDGTIDPLTAIARLRQWAADRKDHSATQSVFDGRARYDLFARRLGPAKDLRVEIKIKPIAGSSKSSWLKSWEPDDGRWVEANLSRDGLAVPQSLLPHGAGDGSRIQLTGECRAPGCDPA